MVAVVQGRDQAGKAEAAQKEGVRVEVVTGVEG